MTYEEHVSSDFGSLLVERAKHMAEIDELIEKAKRLEEENDKLLAKLADTLKELEKAQKRR